jgi:hypothetical protein
MRRTTRLAGSLGLAVSLCASAAQGDPAAETCRVEQQMKTAGESAQPVQRWWLLRAGERVETRSDDNETGELWTRLPGGELHYARIDHVERVMIEHMAGDLAMAGVDGGRLWYWSNPLPGQVDSTVAGAPVTLTIRDCQPAGEARPAMTPLTVLQKYRQVDFIDLGDMAGDAQLQRVTRRLQSR